MLYEILAGSYFVERWHKLENTDAVFSVFRFSHYGMYSVDNS